MAQAEKHTKYFLGFTTGSGKRVSIDPSIMEKARVFLEKENDDISNPSVRNCKIPISSEHKYRETKCGMFENNQHFPAWALYAKQTMQTQKNILCLCDVHRESANVVDEYVTPHIQLSPQTLPPVKKAINLHPRKIPPEEITGSPVVQQVEDKNQSKVKKRRLHFLQDSELVDPHLNKRVENITLVYKSKMSSLANRLMLEEMVKFQSHFNINIEYSEKSCPNIAFTYPHSVLTVTRQNGNIERVHYDIPIFMYLVDIASENREICDESRANLFSLFGNCSVFNEILFHSNYFKTFYRDVSRHYDALNLSVGQDNFFAEFFKGSEILIRIAKISLSAHLQLAERKYNQNFTNRLKLDGFNFLVTLMTYRKVSL